MVKYAFAMNEVEAAKLRIMPHEVSAFDSQIRELRIKRSSACYLEGRFGKVNSDNLCLWQKIGNL